MKNFIKYASETSEFNDTSEIFKEYKSKITFLGLPLFHIIKINNKVPFAKSLKLTSLISKGILHTPTACGVFACAPKAKGIIAVGNISSGVISMGNISSGIIALGNISVGIISVSNISIGILAAGNISIGLFAVGNLVLGILMSYGNFLL